MVPLLDTKILNVVFKRSTVTEKKIEKKSTRKKIEIFMKPTNVLTEYLNRLE